MRHTERELELAGADQLDVDAVVVGTGLAGLTAATTLIQAGLSVAVLEKEQAPSGSTPMSGGWFAFSGTDEQARDSVQDSAELFVKDMLKGSGGKADEALLEAYVSHQMAAYRWLKGLVPNIGVLKISSGQSVPRSHQTDIHALTARLREQIQIAPQATMLFNHRADQLIIESGGRVAGVKASSPAGEMAVTSRGGVVLTTGGFSRATDLLEIFAPKQLAGIPYGGAGNTGDGLKMAWRVGAGFRDMGYVSGTYGSHPETRIEEHELLTAFYMGAIVVNIHGERFMDESDSYKVLGDQCLDQPNGLGFQIFDSVVRAKSQPGVPLSDIGHLQEKGRLFVSDTLRGLAEQSGLDATTLEATVARYNRVAAGETEDEFGRSGLCNGVGTLIPIAEPPFYAYPAKTLMTSTYAGLTVTPEAEVTSIDGGIIPGLYAAGEVVGGFHGSAYMTGTALGKALIFGRVAAQTLRRSMQAAGAREMQANY
ncbi:FAD-dependent oxidoreductase [Arthrobacter sulfonylureivorans]|uniref:FAD-dependent oxidoreductase n=1 Tax=Arthrobacter sulfonylureivorans TaxID=2486855 RepID=UPI0039E331A1